MCNTTTNIEYKLIDYNLTMHFKCGTRVKINTKITFKQIVKLISKIEKYTYAEFHSLHLNNFNRIHILEIDQLQYETLVKPNKLVIDY